jgi:hypothetical protein
MFCRSLFVLLYFLFWPLCCLFFFDIRFLIAPLVSSNSSYKFEMIWFRARFKSWTRIAQISIFSLIMTTFWREPWTIFFTNFYVQTYAQWCQKKLIWPSGLVELKTANGLLANLILLCLSDQEKILLKVFFVDDHPMNILIKLGLNSPFSFGKENQNEKSLQTTTKNAKWWKYLISFGSGQLKSNFSNDIMKIYYHTNKQLKNKKPITSLYHNKYCWLVYKQ